MNKYAILLIVWLFGLILIPIQKFIKTQNIIKGVENNEYYSLDIKIDNSNIYTVKNSNIIFKDKKYTVTYDVFAKCTEYYPKTNTCANSIEKFSHNYSSSASYKIKGTTLNLYLDTVTRTCKINEYNFDIDCTSTGGWKYIQKD